MYDYIMDMILLFKILLPFRQNISQNLLVAGLSQTKELCDSSEKVPDNVVIIASTGVPMPKPPRLSEGNL